MIVHNHVSICVKANGSDKYTEAFGVVRGFLGCWPPSIYVANDLQYASPSKFTLCSSMESRETDSKAETSCI